MKQPLHTHHALTANRRAIARLLILLASTTGLLQTRAADKTWDGGGDQVSWLASPANWVGDVAPAANDQLFFDGAIGLTPNNDFPGGTIFSNLTFNAGAGAFTLSGNGIRLPSGSATLGAITNFSPNTQTITFNITNNGGSRIYRADGPIIISAIISGNTLIKEGTNTLTLTGSLGNPSLGAVINNGLVIMAKSAGSQNSFGGGITVNTNGILRNVGGANNATDQINANQRVNMNGGTFQLQHINSVNTTTLEEVASLSGSNLSSIVECGLPNSTNRLDLGGFSGHRAIYSGTIRDGAAGVMALQVYRNNNYQQFNGTNTYSGVTLINNTAGSGAVRYIMNGAHIGGGAYTLNANAADRFAYLQGSGIISATVINVNAQGLIAPGGSLSADLVDTATFSDSPAILTISNAVNLNTATSSLEIQLNGTNAGTAYDQILIAGSGSLSNNAGNLKLVLGYTPQSGDKFTIVQVQGTDPANNVGVFGSLNGVATDLSQGATFIEPSSGQNFQISYRAEGANFDAGAGNGNDIMLRVVSSPGTNLTWRGDLNNAWDITTTANWRNAGGTALTFTNGDNVTFNDTGSNSLPVDLTTDLSPGNIVVNATNNYVFATSGTGKLTGTVVMVKTNTGTLTILTENDNSGSTLVRQGTLRVGTNGTSGLLSGALDIRTNATVIFSRSDTTTNSGSITGGGTLVHNGTNGTLILTANSTFSGGTIVNAGTLQFGDGSGISGSLNSTVTNNATIAYVYNNAATINNSLTGTGRVELINTSTTSRKFTMGGGPASLTNSTFSGFFHVNPLVCLNTPDLSNGTNQLGVGSTVYVEDTGSLYLDRSGTYLSTFYIQGLGNGAGAAGTPVAMEIEGFSPITTVAGDVYVLSSTVIGGFIGTSRISGRLVDTNGTSTITFANGRAGSSFNLQLGSLSGPNHWGTTIIDPDILNGEQIRVTAMTPRAISTNGLTIGAHGIFQLNGFDHTVASLTSSTVDVGFLPSVFNSSTSTPAIFTVGTDDSSTAFAGVFGDGDAAALGVTKVGAGTLTLSGSSSNTGPVTISAGTIALMGDGSFSNATQIAIDSGAVLDVTARNDVSLNLNSGQTLSGNGGLAGNLVALAGSTVSPGASIGALTVSNNATLAGRLLMEVNRNASPNCDQLTVLGVLTPGGTLQVTNIGAALQPNDTFPLFTSGVSGFTANLPTYDILNARAYTWENDLAANGSVKVLTVAPIPPPVLTNSHSGNSLTFSWSGPFKLQVQTNSVSIGISNNWSYYPAGGASPVTVPIIPGNPTMFFRLSLQ